MQRWTYLAIGVLFLIPTQASAEPEKQVLVILLGDACGKELQLPYFITCLQNERYHKIAKDTVDPRLFDYFYVVFVTVDKQSEHIGYALIEESYGWCQVWDFCIEHEIKHLTEGTLCTSDGGHDRDLVYVNHEWVTCKVALVL